MDFNDLVRIITSVHDELSGRATKAVNFSLTVRNWLIGYYIQEFEQKGSDRASYGDHILQDLSSRLPQGEGFSHRSLKLYRQFYVAYPQFRQTVFAQSYSSMIRQTLSAHLPDRMPSTDNPKLKGEITQGDNPPVCLLLCTTQNQALVEYVCDGMDNQVFVSKYQVCLPGTEEIREFVEGVNLDV
jgi:hypothetical protein